MAFIERPHHPSRSVDSENRQIARLTLNEMSARARDAVTTQVDRYLEHLPSTSNKPLLLRIDLMLPDLRDTQTLNQGIWLLGIPTDGRVKYFALHERSGLSVHDEIPVLFAKYNVMDIMLEPVRVETQDPEAVSLILQENRFPHLTTGHLASLSPELNNIEFHSQLTEHASLWSKLMAGLARFLAEDSPQTQTPAA